MPAQHPIAKQPDKLSPDEAHALKIHNDARDQASKEHNHPRPHLVWDQHLESEARKYAQKLAHDNNGLHHSTGEQRPGQGENLYWVSAGGSLASGSQGWVDEKKNYHGEKIGQGDFGSYGHYTQVIWPATTRVAVASAKSSNGGNFIVGRYSPPGNFTGQDAWDGK
ncbi:MAG: hypothetical protein L6R37_002378 [Teloschistes peruensis]|nr:MAG: hypothetical protein L6R37_002378 [Teloschistes peruensis]